MTDLNATSVRNEDLRDLSAFEGATYRVAQCLPKRCNLLKFKAQPRT